MEWRGWQKAEVHRKIK